MLIFPCEILFSWDPFPALRTLGDPMPLMYLFNDVFGLNKGLIKILFFLRLALFSSTLYLPPLAEEIKPCCE